MVFRVYTEKHPGFDVTARQLEEQIHMVLDIPGLNTIRLINRYDLEGISTELFKKSIPTVFSQEQTDRVSRTLDQALDDPDRPHLDDLHPPIVFAVAPLPGQFDQRADSAAQCIQLIGQGQRPTVAAAKVYVLEGTLDEDQVETIQNYLINPIESHLVSLEMPQTLSLDLGQASPVPVLHGFRQMKRENLLRLIRDQSLAMNLNDLLFCQEHYRGEDRDPTLTELKVIDTYWSDHCRHTTFCTNLAQVDIDSQEVQKTFNQYLAIRRELGRQNHPICLMDMGTIGARYLKKKGILKGVDESEEVNACTVRTRVDVDGRDQDWLFLFKNETHNHPTEIEPFGGAATCIGGAIRDPLSGRSYVYQAMRVSGAADPRTSPDETLPGKLPQRRIVQSAAQGYSSYGNQIGLATGQVHEIYHPGYQAKRMEVGAVLAATPADHVIRQEPMPGDLIILVGGRTGRDGIGGATGSSKSQNAESLNQCGAQVQKGNAPEERKLQRLFRRKEVCRLIKRCNDFGAGGVAVAVGELADGLSIDLDQVLLKYQGLDGTEIALSESQERMAVALDAQDAQTFIQYAAEENLEARVIAQVSEKPNLTMIWQSKTIVDIPRDFLSSNGAPHQARAHVRQGQTYQAPWDHPGSLESRLIDLLSDINNCSQKGLAERFDSTIGASTILMPFGGLRQLTPSQAMVAKLPVQGRTSTVSAMAWGFNPFISQSDPYIGAYLAVVESIARVIASGFKRTRTYLSLQEYYPKPGHNPDRWGLPVAGVLGALQAQLDLGVGAIGGKDSMSGSFENLDVPPTLISFAVSLGRVGTVISPEFKQVGDEVYLLAPRYGQGGLIPEADTLRSCMDLVESLINQGLVKAAATPGYGCLGGSLFEMSLGNQTGLTLDPSLNSNSLFHPAYGSFILEVQPGVHLPDPPAGVSLTRLGVINDTYHLQAGHEDINLSSLEELWHKGLEGVFPYRDKGRPVDRIGQVGADRSPCKPAHESVWNQPLPGMKKAAPRVVIPVFPGTNCEYDSQAAFEREGARVQTLVIRNLTPTDVAESSRALAQAIRSSQIVMLPGGFSGGDEPDGSAKFIASFFRSTQVMDAVRDLLAHRDGLMLGICNGFQALIKLGLVPYGDIVTTAPDDPTLASNSIGRHQSRLVHTRVCSNRSPWFSACNPGDIHTLPISHGEGRFVANQSTLQTLIERDQIGTQYVDANGLPSMNLDVNPNGSAMAVESITSPDGRVLGKMGHTERCGPGLYQNVPGYSFQPLFRSGVAYFTD